MIVRPLRYVTYPCTGNMLSRVTRRNSAGDIAATAIAEIPSVSFPWAASAQSARNGRERG
jgi:hypothetical protein